MIQKIKSNAFDGLRNVSNLILSISSNPTPIEVIEGDAFITTAFVDQIILEAIPLRKLQTNAFRGLSYCRNLVLSNSGITEIEENAFLGANHIEKLDFSKSGLKHIHRNAFNGLNKIETVDLTGNYISKINRAAFEIVLASNQSSISLAQNKNTKRLKLEQNPINCDCDLVWILNETKYLNQISLPQICAGPKGFDCLRLNELSIENLACASNSNKRIDLPCSDAEFDIGKANLNKNNKEISKSEEIDDDYENEDDYETLINDDQEIQDRNNNNKNNQIISTQKTTNHHQTTKKGT